MHCEKLLRPFAVVACLLAAFPLSSGTDSSDKIQPVRLSRAPSTPSSASFVKKSTVKKSPTSPVFALGAPSIPSDFPLRRMEVIPGGQSIGIKLRAAGILVVGYHLVRRGRESFSPAERASIRVGDLITGVNGGGVRSVQEVSQWIEQAGRQNKPLEFQVRRKRELLKVRVSPTLDDDSGMYRIGLFIRDSASGVGTLTFYEPQRKGFGALGHVITDVDTGEAIVGRGQIVHAAVTSIERGESGQPGEKRGLFVNERRVLGTIEQNTAYGVFGFMKAVPDYGFFRSPVQVATASQVHPGEATMLTVVDGQRVQPFRIRIVRVNPQAFADVKGMVIRVTDPVLIAKTGGIVQGMSGSPILQDGRLVGAITHVFVSDPTEGYGIYAQWMVKGLLETEGAAGRRAS